MLFWFKKKKTDIKVKNILSIHYDSLLRNIIKDFISDYKSYIKSTNLLVDSDRRYVTYRKEKKKGCIGFETDGMSKIWIQFMIDDKLRSFQVNSNDEDYTKIWNVINTIDQLEREKCIRSVVTLFPNLGG